MSIHRNDPLQRLEDDKTAKLAFRPFQVDPSWYDFYWHDPSRRPPLVFLAKAASAFSAATRAIAAELMQLRRVAIEGPSDSRAYWGNADVALAKRLMINRDR